jgi:hypothetical protein
MMTGINRTKRHGHNLVPRTAAKTPKMDLVGPEREAGGLSQSLRD